MLKPTENLNLFSELDPASGCDPLYHEGRAREAGYGLIAGIDEAGRGPLAGPVVAAAVILPQGQILDGVRDSKKMTEKSRETAFSLIHRRALAAGIGVISSGYIDQYNILRATLEAMKHAVMALNPQPEFLLIDGMQGISLPIAQKCLKRGDQLCQSIAAASILAKVYRDRIMRSYQELYPEYGFERHKGYGTRQHLEALQKFGISPVHRKTFRGVSNIDSREA